MRFLVSWPGLVLCGLVWFVSRYPQGSAEFVAATLQGIGDFFSFLADLLGMGEDAEPTQ
jgi:hypothetical protein